jgi:hypothetical protein
MRIKEQEKRLTLNEHDDGDEILVSILKELLSADKHIVIEVYAFLFLRMSSSILLI